MWGPSAELTSMPGTIMTPLSASTASLTPETALWSVIATPQPFRQARFSTELTEGEPSEWQV